MRPDKGASVCLQRALYAGVHVPSPVVDKASTKVEPYLELHPVSLKTFLREELRPPCAVQIGVL